VPHIVPESSVIRAGAQLVLAPSSPGMANRRSHSLSKWLYHNRTFTRFYGRMAGRFAVDIVWDDFYADFLRKIPDASTLLEIGAGPGIQAIEILETRPDLKIIVSDFSPKMLELARGNVAEASRENEKIAEREGQLEFVQANAMDLSAFQDRQIDGIYSMGAIKHFPDPLKGLRQAEQVLAGGGIMYFTDSCADGEYSGTTEIVSNLNLTPAVRHLLRPLIHLGLKRESPSSSEVKSWSAEFRSDGGLEVKFSAGGSIFALVYQKPETEL
jgi:ubiquinone/menaquinone biosynthesis C-methylase UbiE